MESPHVPLRLRSDDVAFGEIMGKVGGESAEGGELATGASELVALVPVERLGVCLLGVVTADGDGL